MDFLAHLHPEVVHFPVAFFSIYVLLEIAGIVLKKDFFSKSAHLFLFLGVLGAVAAVLTGNAAENAARALSKAGISIPGQAISEHEDYATFTMWYFTGLLILRTMYTLKEKIYRENKIDVHCPFSNRGIVDFQNRTAGGQAGIQIRGRNRSEKFGIK